MHVQYYSINAGFLKQGLSWPRGRLVDPGYEVLIGLLIGTILGTRHLTWNKTTGLFQNQHVGETDVILPAQFPQYVRRKKRCKHCKPLLYWPLVPSKRISEDFKIASCCMGENGSLNQASQGIHHPQKISEVLNWSKFFIEASNWCHHHYWQSCARARCQNANPPASSLCGPYPDEPWRACPPALSWWPESVFFGAFTLW